MTTATPAAPPPKDVNRLGFGKDIYEGSVSTLCAGCGHDSITAHLIKAFYEHSVNPYDVAKMSGIGCSSKTPAYFLSKSHGFNSVHGRMPSIATGAKAANQSLVAVGVSGDGDTASIGMGQFCHLIRRNLDMVYIIEDNGVYGLTKGQFSATADKGSKQKTGALNVMEVIDCCALAITLDCAFVARSFSGDAKQMVPLLKAAVSHKGLAMLDVISPCVTFNNHEGSTKSYTYVKDHDKPIHAMDYVEPQPETVVDYAEGTTQKVDFPDGSQLLLRKLGKDYDPTNKAAALTALDEARREGVLLTGLLYVNPAHQDFNTVQNTVDRPLWALGEAETRPAKAVLEQILSAYR